MEELSKEEPFDLLLTDTSLFQSIIGAIQSVKGKRVLQIDGNSFYGGPQAGTHKIPVSFYGENTFIYHDPSPIIFYARGPLSDLLLSLDLTEYVDFMGIDQQYIWPSERVFIPLPLRKEQVMLEQSLTLLEKRKLSKLLGFATILAASTTLHNNSNNNSVVYTLGDLLKREGVNPESRVFQLIAYGVCRCSSLEEVQTLSIQQTFSILNSFKESIRHLNELGSPFVLPLWGSSELSQAACRKSAVFGCVQVFEKCLNDVELANIKFKKLIRSIESSKNSKSIFRSSFVLNRSVLGLSGNVLITIPPLSDLIPEKSASCINILQLSSDSKCCPNGTWIIYLWSFEPIPVKIESLLIETSEIIFSFPSEQVLIPFYKLTDNPNTNEININNNNINNLIDTIDNIDTFDTFDNIDTFDTLTSHPVIPASFTFEECFINSLKSLQ